MSKGKMQLVFDCQEMPKDVKEYFFNHYGEGKCNDVYIRVYIEGGCDDNDIECDYSCEECEHRVYDIVERWLLDNGAKDECVVKRWW